MVTECKQHRLDIQNWDIFATHEASTKAPQGLEAQPVSGDKLKEMSTAPKVKLLTQTMDVIYSALFEGDKTRMLPKITSFPIRIFGFLIFFWDFFRYFENLEKE